MSTRHAHLFIPQARPQPANQPANPSQAHPQPPPLPEVKPRKPSEKYCLANGFKSPHYVSDGDRPAWEQDRDALAMWALENLGEAPPSLESLKKGVTPIMRLSPEEIQTRISQRTEEHENDLRKLYEYQAGQREDLLHEHRKVVDGGDFYPIGELESRDGKPVPPLSYAQCNEELDMQTLEFNDIVERFIYGHQQSQRRLREALTHAKTRANDAESQRKWDEEAQHVALNTGFPQSIEAYNKITNRNHKLRVSRLLVAPTTEEKEQIAGSSRGLNWSEEDCTPLMSVFGSDPRFAEKVHEYIQSSQSTDPRRRPTA